MSEGSARLQQLRQDYEEICDEIASVLRHRLAKNSRGFVPSSSSPLSPVDTPSPSSLPPLEPAAVASVDASGTTTSVSLSHPLNRREKDEQDVEGSLSTFPPEARCLYLMMLAQQYVNQLEALKLKKERERGSLNGRQDKEKANVQANPRGEEVRSEEREKEGEEEAVRSTRLKREIASVFEQTVILAREHLEPTNELRLQIAFLYSHALFHLLGDMTRALTLATTEYEAAYEKVASLSPHSIHRIAMLMQQLREVIKELESKGAVVARAAHNGNGIAIASNDGKRTHSKARKQVKEKEKARLAVFQSLMCVQDPLYEEGGVPLSALPQAEELAPALYELFSHYADTKAFGARMMKGGMVTVGKEVVKMDTFLSTASQGALAPKMSLASLVQLLRDLSVIPALLKEEEILDICRIALKADGEGSAESRTILFAKGHTEHDKFYIAQPVPSSSSIPSLSLSSTLPPELVPVQVSYRGFVDLLGCFALVAGGLPQRPKGESGGSTSASLSSGPAAAAREGKAVAEGGKKVQTAVDKIASFLLEVMKVTDTAAWRQISRAGIEGLGDDEGRAAMASKRTPKKLGYDLQATKKSSEFSLSLQTQSLLLNKKYKRPLHQIFNFYRRLQSSQNAAPTFDGLAGGQELLRLPETAKMAADFDLSPKLIAKQTLSSIYQSALRRGSVSPAFSTASPFPSPASSSPALASAPLPTSPPSSTASFLPEWSALRGAERGFAMFLEFLVRVAEEAFGQEQHRLEGKYCTQESQLEGLLRYMEIDEASGGWRAKMTGVDITKPVARQRPQTSGGTRKTSSTTNPL